MAANLRAPPTPQRSCPHKRVRSPHRKKGYHPKHRKNNNNNNNNINWDVCHHPPRPSAVAMLLPSPSAPHSHRSITNIYSGAPVGNIIILDVQSWVEAVGRDTRLEDITVSCWRLLCLRTDNNCLFLFQAEETEVRKDLREAVRAPPAAGGPAALTNQKSGSNCCQSGNTTRGLKWHNRSCSRTGPHPWNKTPLGRVERKEPSVWRVPSFAREQVPPVTTR